MNALTDQLRELNNILDQVPPEHRGVSFERVFRESNPYECTQLLERAFAILWAKRNGAEGLLTHIMHAPTIDGGEQGPRAEFLPQNKREWDVTLFAAASIMQWLATPTGLTFQREAFRMAGGSMTYTLPKTAGNP